MKRKWLALGLSAVMVSGLAACGGGAASSTAPAAESTKAESTAPAAESTKAESTAAVEGTTSTLNIYCWNEEFKTRLEDHYPGYEKIDATHGKIGDVAVNFNITPNT
ncbi:MAG: carbohydrate ABC transporter substrate-binding protein, partial [Lachnospiraceae bacterium]|nr:carbohydrate ABC transporter substrate-binding protein [Lachnospiraceae bacterium]